MAGSPLLRLSDVHAAYGAAAVLFGIDLEVRDGEVVCLLGRNGAGKSTTIKTISGLLQPSRGSISFAEQELTGCSPMEIVGRGIAVVPEGRRVFPSLTVQENLTIGAYAKRSGIVPKVALEEIHDLFPRLAERRNQMAGTLSGGEQQMLAMGRAMMARPRMLLMDEPSMGLAPLLIDQVFETINYLAKQGITILLIEQNAAAALDIADRAYVIERGRVVLSGDAADLQESEEVRSTYLGV